MRRIVAIIGAVALAAALSIPVQAASYIVVGQQSFTVT